MLGAAEARVHEPARLAVEDLVPEDLVLEVLRDVLEVGHLVEVVRVGVDDQDVLEAALLRLPLGVLEVEARVVAGALAGVEDLGLDGVAGRSMVAIVRCCSSRSRARARTARD